MDHAKQVALLETLIGYIQNQTTGMLKSDSMQPCDLYGSRSVLNQEIEMLFRNQPVLLGVSSQIPNPGDFITKQVLQWPVLLTRDHNGQLRGFFNVCRHRAACLVREPAGSGKKSFACPYHGWTYNTQGDLIHIPHEVGFPSVNQSLTGLRSFDVVESQGLIFATIGQEKATHKPLESIEADVQELDIPGHRVFKQLRLTTQSNWKQSLEQFLEAYHIKFIHRNSVRQYFVDHVQQSESLGLHARFMFPRRNILDALQIDKTQWRFRDYANALYLIFPNTFLLVQQDHLILATVWPRGTGESDVDYQMLIPSDTPDNRLPHFEFNHEVMLVTMQEDIENGNLVQKGLESGAHSHVHFGRFEQAIAYFHQAIRKCLESPKS